MGSFASLKGSWATPKGESRAACPKGSFQCANYYAMNCEGLIGFRTLASKDTIKLHFSHNSFQIFMRKTYEKSFIHFLIFKELKCKTLKINTL